MTIMERAHMAGYDGYDVIGKARADGWRAISSWGRDGWDLGSWPLVIVFFREKAGEFQAAYYVEGDVEVRSFASEAERAVWIDELAFFHWRQQQEPWVEGITWSWDLPEKFRGPFSWERLDKERPA